jgi:hypothetical protein
VSRRAAQMEEPGLERGNVLFDSIYFSRPRFGSYFNRSFSPEDSPSKLIYVRELDSELPLDRGHVDRVS